MTDNQPGGFRFNIIAPTGDLTPEMFQQAIDQLSTYNYVSYDGYHHYVNFPPYTTYDYKYPSFKKTMVIRILEK